MAIVAREDFPNICRFVFTVSFAEAALGVDTEMALGIDGLLRDEDRLKAVIETIENNPTDVGVMLERGRLPPRLSWSSAVSFELR